MNLKGLSVLLLEDEPLLKRRMAAYLVKQGAEVMALGTVAEAERAIQSLDFEFALLDVNLPDGRSLRLLEERRIAARVAVLVMTAEGGVEGAVEAMRLGAADYLVKPFEMEELSLRMARARRELQARRGEQHRREQEKALGDSFFFGKSLDAVRQHLGKIIAADRRLAGAVPPPVLIEGETGTGKTMLARWIHHEGPRSEGPLVELNCSAVSETLAESELFGHERGAFTDAKEARIGLLEAAEGGTLFLDEIPSLSPGTQAKLLKAIEDCCVRRVGGTRSISIDARIIAATNVDLRQLAAKGQFREDLLQRLDLYRVKIPPLRERGEDMVELAETLAARIARKYGQPVRPIPAEGRRRLLAYAWPGNARELAHEIERSLVFGEDHLNFSGLDRMTASQTGGIPAEGCLNPAYRFPIEGFSLDATIDGLVKRALDQCGGNVSAAARLLGITRDALRYRLKTPPGSDA